MSLSLSLRGGEIVRLSISARTAAGPPVKKVQFPIVSGIGTHIGVRGTMTPTPLSEGTYRAKFDFV